MNNQDPGASAPNRIEAATFQVAIDAPPAANSNPRLRQMLLIAATFALAFITFVVIVVLPRWVAAPVESGVKNPAAASRPVVVEALPETLATGPSDSVTAVATREDTQAKLRKTLEKLSILEALKAEQWAKTDLFEIRQRIAAGEKAYRENRYVTAQNIYLETAATVERLLAQVPNIVESLLDAGNLALANGNSSAAMAAFEQVISMSGDNAVAVRGRKRATTLDQVLALVGQAEGYERLEQRDKAASAYREALSIDALAPGAAAAIQRIESRKRKDAFRAAMSAGISALDKHRFSQARQAFGRAEKLDPGRSEVTAALRQVDNAKASFHIDRHLSAAREAETAERWGDAFKEFTAALTFDARLSPALAGKRQAGQRRRLDAQLVAYLARPERLSAEKVHLEASQVLARARALKASGARIDKQITTLARALELAHTPLPVVLRSDNTTAVTVYRVGELGQFEQRELALLPGTYTALGKRDGYRDVRVEFTLQHGTVAPAPVIIQCSEKFAFGN
jgi:tetratricopeptide (TPR) repeat protein